MIQSTYAEMITRADQGAHEVLLCSLCFEHRQCLKELQWLFNQELIKTFSVPLFALL